MQEPKQWKPHDYQRKAMKFLLEHASAALWLDPGLGKTSITLGAFKVLKNSKVGHRMLVIAPLRPCYLVWPKERDDWTDFNELSMTVLHGPGKDKAIYEDSDIFVINPDGLQWLLSKPVIGTDKHGHPLYDKRTRLQIIDCDTLAIDEVTKFKHTNTSRFKLMRPVLYKFARRWTLTGTPIPNGYMDLFGQIYMADTGNALGQYITHYRNTYFDPVGYMGYDWELRKGSEKLIQDKLRSLVLRMSAEDYIKLPKLIINPIYVDLPMAVRKIYDDMEEEMLATLTSGNVVTALSAGAATSKCRQVACGGLYTQKDAEGLIAEVHSGPRKWEDLHTVKIDACIDLIEELGGKPVFLVYEFHHDLARMRKAFGADMPVLGGKGSGPLGIKYDKALEQAWNENKIPLMAGHPASIGHGLNLQKGDCQDIIFHSDTWDFELYDQLIRRLRRQGSKHSVIRAHHIIARNTIDEDIYAGHDTKGTVQQKLMQALNRVRRKKPVPQVIARGKGKNKSR